MQIELALLVSDLLVYVQYNVNTEVTHSLLNVESLNTKKKKKEKVFICLKKISYFS